MNGFRSERRTFVIDEDMFTRCPFFVKDFCITKHAKYWQLLMAPYIKSTAFENKENLVHCNQDAKV